MKLKALNTNVILYVITFLIGASLLLKDQISTIFILGFIAINLSLSWFSKQKIAFSYFFLIPSLLLLPRILGIITGDNETAVNEIIRSLPLLILFVPLFLFKTENKNSIKNIEKGFYHGSLIGVLLFMLICNYNVAFEMISNSEPIEYLFRWRHMNINFAKPLDVHPPYAGILAVFVLIKTLFNKYLNNLLKTVIVSLMLLLLIQLLARNALMVSVLAILYFSIKNLNYKILILSAVVGIAVVALVSYHPHPYLKKKLFDRFNFTDSEQFDKRIDRLKPSYNVFITSPLFGVGPGFDNQLRRQEYKSLNYYNAYKFNFNSHNQFIEYLVFSGVFGLALFLYVIFSLFRMALKSDKTNLLLIIAFIISCFTESVLERSLGIKYFSILSLLILLSYQRNYQSVYDKNGK